MFNRVVTNTCLYTARTYFANARDCMGLMLSKANIYFAFYLLIYLY